MWSFLVRMRFWPSFMDFQEQVVCSVHLFSQADKELTCDYYISPGRHCCLWCEVESKNLKLPLNAQGPSPENPNRRKPSPSRSLETLRRDYKSFLTRGKGDLKKAKGYNNVIGPYFFDIPLDQVCGKTAFCTYTTLSLITQMAMTMVLYNAFIGLSTWATHQSRHFPEALWSTGGWLSQLGPCVCWELPGWIVNILWNIF